MPVSINWGNPAASTCGGAAPACGAPTALAAAGFDSNLCAAGSLFDNCISQPGTGTQLESLPHWVMGPGQFRNFGGYQTIVFNATVDADGTGHAGVRWYELRRVGGVWSINQQATFAPDAGPAGMADDPERWMGSIAMDKAGNMALGYSASDNGTNNVFPSVRYVGRQASDPGGLLPHGEVTVIAGGNSQIINGSRWGDYSAMRVDPVDDCTFWYTQEYIQAGNPFGAGNGGAWATQIAAFRFPSCSATDLAITKSDSPDPVTAGNILTYTVTVTNNGPNNATNVVVTDTLPSGVTYLSDSDSCAQAPVGTLTCSLGALASGANTSFTIQVRVPADYLSDLGVSTANITNTASVAASETDTNFANNTATATTTVNEQADLRILKECKPDQPNKQPAGMPTFCDIYVDNLGPSDARNVVITDTIISTTPIVITAIVSAPRGGTATCPATPFPVGTTTNVTITCNDAILEAGAGTP
jgi:uncharacterized repeat protein (TIGR01451 family)